jgi:SPP1 gp7 family putative phage head morphogenesis protein
MHSSASPGTSSISENLNSELKKSYSGALQDIQKEVAYFYSKYSTDGTLSYTDAMKYKRLDSLMKNLRDIILNLTGQEQTSIEDLLASVCLKSYYETIYDAQKGLNLGFSFTKINQNVVKEILTTPWSGENYSQRLYANRDLLVRNLKQTLTNGFIKGQSNQKMARDLNNTMGTGYKNTVRLVRTETTYVANNATIAGYKECSVDQYKYLSTLDSRTSNVCRNLDGKIFNTEDAQSGVNLPAMHPHCRSTTIPYFGQDIVQRIARDKNGKTYYVDGNITYEEWTKQNNI